MTEELMQEMADLFDDYLELTSDIPFEKRAMPVRARVLDAPTQGDFEELDITDLVEIQAIPLDVEDWPGNTEFNLTYWATQGAWSLSFYPLNDTGLYISGSELDEVLQCGCDALSKRIAFILGDTEACAEDFERELAAYLEGGLDGDEEG